MNPLIVDTDGGIDDAMALLFLASHDHHPELITTCFGNVSISQASENILDTLELINCNCPVFAGCESPILGPPINAVHIHGTDGLGGAKRPTRKSTVQSTHAVDVLRNRLRQAIEEKRQVDILALGPLTNLAITFLLEPSLISGIGRLVIMGGTHSGRGNDTETAEFNIAADPESAAIVLNLPAKTELVTWEPCVENPIAGNVIDDSFKLLKQSELKSFAKSLCGQGRKVHQEIHDTDDMVMADPLAASVVLEPNLVTESIFCPVMVECSGDLTRGMTIPIRRPVPASQNSIIKVVKSVNYSKFEAAFKKSISWIDTIS